ncbi:recombinase family protein [Criibacterium bergeronii]|uniref:Recombinase family protein n=1 Tax=Criibacterium bergeronii TaxID=1871336 RepID=A0A371ILB1_9FIRM|nr:recombinase family protein [Criibacterium bergeronii]MBS6064094.1 recombinase family protein [Peptostreptococcaceae bacterium]RDY21236.1 recombinase family protein [Criibacterium bergeronii]
MPNKPNVYYIPPKPTREKRVGIYCRVSTNSMDQLQSLTAQIPHLTRLTASMLQWVLSDAYIDISTSKTSSSRKEFNRMLDDCRSRKLDMVITKNISRFGRDTVEILDALNQLKTLGIRVVFEQEELDTANTDSDLMIAIIEALAQAENESRSENIKWGIKQRAALGTSKLYDRKCYGYKHNSDGKRVIDKEQAENVRLIFDLYLSGKSVLGIIKELQKREILYPTGKEKWCKRTIDVMLSYEKYTGDVKLLKSGKSDVHYLASENNPAIISTETFEAVQIEKGWRSNVVKDENGSKRKSEKYSSKKKD